MDKQYWDDPEQFRPERFITDDGKLRFDERVVPFGIGKRRCPGESLARMETLMMFANILRDFSFSAGTPPDLSPEAGFTNGPPKFKMRVKIL